MGRAAPTPGAPDRAGTTAAPPPAPRAVPGAGSPIAYVVSRYPTVSHSFIRREVQTLRARGVNIHTFSVRRPSDAEVLSPADQAERDRTFALLPCPPRVLGRAHLGALARSPVAYLRTLALAMRHRVPGPRSALWGLFHFGEAIVLADQLRQRGVGHVHSHFSNAGGVVGMLASRFLDIGWSLTIHGSKADFQSPARVLLGDKVAATTFTACISRFCQGQLRQQSEAAVWDRIAVVRCGIELSKFPFRARPAIEGRRARLLSVGRLAPEKGQLGLLEGFAELVRRGVDAELRLIGEGPERPRLEAAVVRLGIADRCTLPGAYPEKEIAREMAEADAFVLSSFIEGLPVVLMEAMASGLPVVAPALNGIPELVIDGQTGSLFPTGDWAGLASQLQNLLADPRRAAAMAVRGRAKVEAEFDIEVAVAPLWQRFSSGLRDSGQGTQTSPLPDPHPS
jgi:colanic acid/amylovoran biosynthesis glycosyltransferase